MNHRPAILLFLLTACVFLPSLRNGFVVYDDIAYIHENPLVTSPHTGAALLAAWTKPYEQNHTPLLWTTFRGIHALFGTNPLAYHLPSVLIHAGNAVLLFFVILKLGARPHIATIIAALWAVHPQRVESVSWASALKDPASTWFALCFTWFWLEARNHPNRNLWWIAASLALTLSLLFKQAAMTLPFVLYAWHLISRSRDTPLLLVRNLPLMALGLAGASIAAMANRDAFTHATYLNFQSIWDQPVHALAALAFALYKTVIPIGLMLDYPVPANVGIWAILGCVIIIFWGFYLARCIKVKDHRRTFCLLWIAGLWLPASGVVPTPLEFTADRLTYLPGTMLIAFVLLTPWRASDRVVMVTASVLLLLLGFLSVNQQLRWKAPETLIAHCLRVDERHYPSILNDAILRLQRGEDPQGPIRSLENAIETYPHRSAAYHRLIQIHRIMGEEGQAETLRQRWQKHCQYDKDAFR